jgi:hypothetical protein
VLIVIKRSKIIEREFAGDITLQTRNPSLDFRLHVRSLYFERSVVAEIRRWKKVRRNPLDLMCWVIRELSLYLTRF